MCTIPSGEQMFYQILATQSKFQESLGCCSVCLLLLGGLGGGGGGQAEIILLSFFFFYLLIFLFGSKNDAPGCFYSHGSFWNIFLNSEVILFWANVCSGNYVLLFASYSSHVILLSQLHDFLLF